MKVYEIVEKAPQFEAYFFPGGIEHVPDATRFIFAKTGQTVSWQPAVEFVPDKHGQGEILFIHGRRTGATVERNLNVRPRTWLIFEGPGKLYSMHEASFAERFNVVMEREDPYDGDAQPE